MAKLIGTAGHVDHGKTTLLQALTGIDADRLPEEKERGMTIDIGFAFVDLPGHGRVSIVDVPGHERFLTNMLVGALGIDVALLCVAADAGVMPQTREHLAILDVLPVASLVVALTRSDLADVEMQALVSEEIQALVAETHFKEAPIVATSATTGQGLDALRQALAEALGEEEVPPEGEWFLPIDRAFNIKGHGAVVTGTLAKGRVKVGDRAVLQPGGREVRVRAIHVHGEPVEQSERGRRTAINLSGVRLEDLDRGMSLGSPGAVFESRLVDAWVRWTGPHRHGQNVRVSIGAEEAIATMFLNDTDRHLAQLRFDRPVACSVGQPLVLRRYSPPDLVAGGRVEVPLAKPRKKKEATARIATNDPYAGVIEAIGTDPNGVPTDEICRRLGRTPQSLGNVFERLLVQGRVMGFAGVWIQPSTLDEIIARIRRSLADLHTKNPTQAYIPRDKVIAGAGLRWSGKPLDRLVSALDEKGVLAVHGPAIRDVDFQVTLTPRQRELFEKVKALIEKEPINVPSPSDLSRMLPAPRAAVEEMLHLGLEARELIRVEESLFYTPRQIDSLRRRIREVSQGRPFSPSQIREALGTSRKYIIPLLEYFDSTRFTQRVGENRVVRG